MLRISESLVVGTIFTFGASVCAGMRCVVCDTRLLAVAYTCGAAV